MYVDIVISNAFTLNKHFFFSLSFFSPSSGALEAKFLFRAILLRALQIWVKIIRPENYPYIVAEKIRKEIYVLLGNLLNLRITWKFIKFTYYLKIY